VTDFLDSPLTNAECLIMQERAPHLVAIQLDGTVVPAVGVTRRYVAQLQARFPSMTGPQAPATPMSPTATNRYPNTTFPPKTP